MKLTLINIYGLNSSRAYLAKLRSSVKKYPTV